jgi:crossover junction endodeoxyribonuclease RuvC
MLKLEYVPRRLDATDGMAVAMCHYYTARTPISQAMGTARVKGLGGGKKAAKGSSSWEAFIKQNPEREIK